MGKKRIENVNIITMNEEREIIEDGFVLVDKDTIVGVGTMASIHAEKIENDYEVINGNNGILMPGMVNCHTHVPMVVFRSLGDDVADRLKKYIFPLEKMLVNEELVYKGAKYGIAEMLLGGVTTFCDTYYYQDQVAAAVKEMGIRAILGETIVDFVAPDAKRPYEGLEYCEWFIEKWKEDRLITPAVAPHAPYTNDAEHLQRAYVLAKKYQVPLIMHVAEMDYEQKKYREEYNMTPVEYLDYLGILDGDFIGAHLINVTETDLDILERREVGISHNVGANSKGAKGVAPAVEMYRRKMKLGLGTDGPMSGNTLDILTQMSLVGKIHKLHNGDRTLFPAEEIVEMATIGGARVLNLDREIGSIEVGKRADLVLFETESINMNPIYDYYATLVYAANPGNVDTVVVNGEVLVKNKKMVKSNLAAIKEGLMGMREKIWQVAKEL